MVILKRAEIFIVFVICVVLENYSIEKNNYIHKCINKTYILNLFEVKNITQLTWVACKSHTQNIYKQAFLMNLCDKFPM